MSEEHRSLEGRLSRRPVRQKMVGVEPGPPESADAHGGTASTPSGSSKNGRGGTRPSRKHPAHPPVVETFNRSIIVYVTVCTKDRRPVLANAVMHELLCRAWDGAGHWRVGRYVVMPDHIHFFCAPGTYPPTSVKKWVEYWKGNIARALKGHGPLAEYGRGGTRPSTWDVSRDDGRGGTRPSRRNELTNDAQGGTRPVIAESATGGTASTPSGSVPSMWPDPLWQRDCWDTQLRRGENYHEKWEYVRLNPVRANLCEFPDDWPYQGEMNVLQWHD